MLDMTARADDSATKALGWLKKMQSFDVYISASESSNLIALYKLVFNFNFTLVWNLRFLYSSPVKHAVRYYKRRTFLCMKLTKPHKKL